MKNSFDLNTKRYAKPDQLDSKFQYFSVNGTY
jgi:hypothetical protein